MTKNQQEMTEKAYRTSVFDYEPFLGVGFYVKFGGAPAFEVRCRTPVKNQFIFSLLKA
jgi:hypothetical protein